MSFKMLKLIFLLLFIHNIPNLYCQNVAPIITIPDGQLRGTVSTTEFNNVTFYAYRGIPYAKPPLGNLRFAAPVKNDPWQNVHNATADKDMCPQLQGNIANPLAPGTVLGSEDCLYINVYTTNVNGSLPVMLFIHPGGFNTGNTSYARYAPDYFLEKDVIYVGINYRIGIFGFLSTEDMAAPGNWGLKDQALALKWIKDNIKFFGGNPNKVTIFGQSAGSALVSYLVQSNLTRGLFNGAIMQSGTVLGPWALNRNARNRAFAVGLKLGILTLSSQDLINRLRTVDYKELKLKENEVTLVSIVADNILAGIPFGPVKEPDHAGAAFTAKSWQLLSAGEFPKVPLIIGENSNEVGLITSYVLLLTPLWLQYEAEISRLAPADLTQNYLRRLAAALEIRFHFFKPFIPLSFQASELTTYINQEAFYRPIRETVRLMSRYTNVFFYKFSYQDLVRNPNRIGVYHQEELEYLFARRHAGDNAENKLTSERLVELWTNFAKTGNPTPAGVSNSSVVNVTWVPNTPSTDANTSMKYLNINRTLTMEENPDQSNWQFYQYIYSRHGSPPYDTY